MRDQSVERQAATGRVIAHDDQVCVLPLRRDADPRFTHERSRKREGQRFAVETCKHYFTAVRKPRNQAVEQGGVTARVVDRFVIAAR